MSGDFSRFKFNPKKAYNKVLMQQGRVILDADWNEMQAIQDWKNESMVGDLIGSIAFPKNNPAFSPDIIAGLSFSGVADFVLIEKQGPYFDANKSFTLEAKITAEQSEHSMAIISQWQDAVHLDGECGFCFGVTPEGLLFFFRSILNEQEVEIDELFSIEPLTFGVSSNVAVTYDGKIVKLFINGDCVAATTEASSGYIEVSPTIIGASLFTNIPERCFKGQLADIRIWSRCFRESEFNLDSFKHHKIGEIGLQAWWPLNEGQGHIARDISGHGFDGLLGAGVENNSPKWLNKKLSFSTGRMYLAGSTVENFEDVLKESPELSAPEGHFLAYANMQQTLISGAQDNDIIEPALGTDSTLRQKTLLDISYFPEEGTLASTQLLAQAWQAHCEPLSRPGRLKVDVLNNHGMFENALYRIEINQSVDLKNQQSLQVLWTADNSSLQFGVAHLKNNSVTVYGVANTNTVIKPGDFIGLSDEHGNKLQQGHQLLKVTDVDYEHETIDFSGAINKPEGKVIMNVWRSDVCQVSPNKAGDFELNIDNKLKLTFESNCYYDEKSYWLIPSRRVSNSILWPINSYQKMSGVPRQIAALAEFRCVDKTCWLYDDKRPYFYSASEGESFIRKSGGTFTGSVTIDGDLTLNGNLSDNSIGTMQLKDKSVDFHKIQENLGLHLGQCVLSQCAVPSAGFSKVGKLRGDTENSAWSQQIDLLPFNEPFMALNVEDSVYILYGNGDVFKVNQNIQTLEFEFINKSNRPGNAIRRFASCAHDGFIYVAGGENAEGEKSADFYRYSITEDYWQKLHPLKQPVSHLSLCASQGYVYAMGGMHNAFFGLLKHDPSDKNERYDPLEDTWHSMADIPDYRYSASAVEFKGDIHLIGGSDRELSGLLSESFQSTHFVYEPSNNQWSERNPIPLARSRFGAMIHNDKIYCLGGKTGNGYTGNVQVYKPETDYWQSSASLNYPRSHAAAVILGDHMVALSGKTAQGYVDVIEEQVLSTDFYVHRLDNYL